MAIRILCLSEKRLKDLWLLWIIIQLRTSPLWSPHLHQDDVEWAIDSNLCIIPNTHLLTRVIKIIKSHLFMYFITTFVGCNQKLWIPRAELFSTLIYIQLCTSIFQCLSPWFLKLFIIKKTPRSSTILWKFPFSSCFLLKCSSFRGTECPVALSIVNDRKASSLFFTATERLVCAHKHTPSLL